MGVAALALALSLCLTFHCNNGKAYLFNKANQAVMLLLKYCMTLMGRVVCTTED